MGKGIDTCLSEYLVREYFSFDVEESEVNNGDYIVILIIILNKYIVLRKFLCVYLSEYK